MVKEFAPGKKLGSALMARRKLSGFLPKGLLISSGREQAMDRLTSLGKTDDGRHKQRISWTESFAESYVLGVEVMPSTNPGMKILHAMRLSDSERVVVKVRDKKNSFISQEEIDEWVASTELVLNLPKSGTIAQLYEVLEDCEKYYIIMELVDGEDLCETLDCQGRLPMSDCKEIVRQIIHAVSTFHQNGCIHRDIKLENVMIQSPKLKQGSKSRPSGQPVRLNSAPGRIESSDAPSFAGPVVKIIDFDTIEEWKPSYGGRERSATQTPILGTDQYIAQEAYEGKYSPSSDMFAVGVIAFKLITGCFPFSPTLFDAVNGENYAGSPKMRQIQEKLKQYNINWWMPPFPADNAALSFCKSLLTNNEGDRPSAEEALRHAWLKL